MKETIKSIIDWHEITFPDATLEGQLEKTLIIGVCHAKD